MTHKTSKRTICPLDCPDACAIVAILENDRIVKLDGDPEHETTRGFLCRKMRHYHEHIHSDQRILHPMKRVGAKGKGEFVRIDWSEAWQILVERLKEIKSKHGGEALLPFSYAGNMGHISQSAGNPFLHRFGATRLDPTICSATAKAGWRAHMGDRSGNDPSNAAEADLIVVWGINVKVTNIHFWPMIQKSRRKGGKLVVIDPYRNVTAKAADYYFPVKPSGDAALALGVLKVVIEENMENAAYIEKHTNGFEEFRSHVRSLEWPSLETESGISKEKIAELAGLFIKHPKAFIRIGIGLSRNSRGAMSVRAICCLAAALGLPQGDTGKGVLLSSGAFGTDDEKLDYGSLSNDQTRLVNMLHLGDALTDLKPKIHGLFVYNANPLSVAPDAVTVKKGLLRDDLFTVVHEQVMTPTARYADLLLPATTSFENADVYTAYGNFYMGITEPVIEPQGEAISNFDLFQTLAVKMGYNDPPFKQTLDERLKDYLATFKGFPTGVAGKTLKPGEYIKSIRSQADHNLKHGFKIDFVSKTLPQDQPVLPSLTKTIEFGNKKLESHYPLKLITPPHADLLNSTFGYRYPNESGTLLIHPLDADQRKIKTDDMVIIENKRGICVRRAVVSTDTQPGLVVAEGIYWETEDYRHQGINDLTSQRLADLGRGGTFHESLVEVINRDPKPRLTA